jgi:hypothetical protein
MLNQNLIFLKLIDAGTSRKSRGLRRALFLFPTSMFARRQLGCRVSQA